MKAKLLHVAKLIFAFLVIVTLFSCKKEEITSRLSAAERTDFQTDGIITVAESVLPPATRETFIANGRSSKAVFQLLSSQVITIENAYFSGPYPLIQYITAKNIGVAVNHESGQMGLTGVGTVDDKGMRLVLNVFYNAVDSNTSGSVAQLNLTSIQYRTHDGLYRSFDLSPVISAPPVCIVNNVPHILFQDPDNDTLQNGFKQIIKVKLTGDTAWRLKKLPLNLWSPYLRTIPQSKLIVKHKGDKIAESEVLQLNPNSRIETVITFENAFKHVAGETEILKIYAKTPQLDKKGNTIFTIMYPLSSLVWIDGLGAKMPGDKNKMFFKEETGDATYDEY